MRDLLPFLPWIALGSAVGGVARFLLAGLVARRLGEVFPWGTLVVNVSGALAIGFLAAVPGPGLPPGIWLAVVVGGLGSYTTVSSFALQTLTLARIGRPRLAAWNVALSVGLCLGAAALGFVAGGAWPAGVVS